MCAEQLEVAALLQTHPLHVRIEHHFYHTFRRRIKRSQQQECVGTTPHHDSEQNSWVGVTLLQQESGIPQPH